MNGDSKNLRILGAEAPMDILQADQQKIAQRSKAILDAQLQQIAKRTDHIMVVLLIAQWLFGVFIAYTVSPLAWHGDKSYLHPHIFYAGVLGGIVTAVPVYFALKHSDWPYTRHVVAVGQMLMSSILIHLMGGRIETHFHVFGSLAILTFYRDWRVLVTATTIVAADHFLRGTYLPLSVFGLENPGPWRWVEHAGWVVFEDIFLVMMCVHAVKDLAESSNRQAQLEVSGDFSRTLNEIVNSLYTSGSRISEALAELASNAQQTLAAVTETTTIVGQVRQTAEVSSHKARKVAEDAQTVTQISEKGVKAADQTVDSMKHIREQMLAIAASMLKLSNQSKMIGEIIAAVDDLAQQSNLLSVNASIEAAKAGEYGRGFAVVAQEVKNLSNESKQATANVRKLLNEIVTATESATISTELGKQAVAAGEDVVKQARASILTLSESIMQASHTSTQIEVSSQQQLVGMQQVVTAMASVKDASNHNVVSVRDLEQAVNNLNDLGRQLREMVAEYKKGKEMNRNGHSEEKVLIQSAVN